MKTINKAVHLINKAADEQIRGAAFHRRIKARDPGAAHEIPHMQGSEG
ncbi:hypothetical protein KTQ42_23535 [Noviherbaspirillum sp. L7-7A]|nr:hypothetical protein [Noviherbaspirillum sp. L7-7A]MBV0882252.1 hypothetical protein [Noviherbaspirillum sp. L7-7A]